MSDTSRRAARTTETDPLRNTVQGWFAPDALAERMGPPRDPTERICRDWLAGAGKRWRPYLLAGSAAMLSGGPEKLSAAAWQAVADAAVAVECFHKASLIHDDIEDGDATRYGLQTLHERWGAAVAINAGDLLLGEGYRLLAGLGRRGVEAETVSRVLFVAADCHRRLCLGQGTELLWRDGRRSLPPGEVMEIYAGKTSPAFELALRAGALLAAAATAVKSLRELQLQRPLGAFARHMGIAYQIADDLEDLAADAARSPADRPAPGILASLATDAVPAPSNNDEPTRANGDQPGRQAADRAAGTVPRDEPERTRPASGQAPRQSSGQAAEQIRRSGAPDAALRLISVHRREARTALDALRHAPAAGLDAPALAAFLADVLDAVVPTAETPNEPGGS